MSKNFKILLWLILLLFIGAGIISVFLVKTALDRDIAENDYEEGLKFSRRTDNLKQWVDSILYVDALKDTIITMPDGRNLHSYILSQDTTSQKLALLVHGYKDNGLRMLPIGKIYSDKGFNILLPDLHAHGKSDGKRIQMGWKDRKDILHWIEVGKAMYGDSVQIALHGVSMGGATVMMTAGENLPTNVKLAVEDCGYTSVWDEYSHELRKRFHLTPFPFLHMSSALTQQLEGWNFRKASSVNQLKKSKIPMFFIHGGDDDFVPTEMVYKLYDAKPDKKEIWVKPNVGHADMYWQDPHEYNQKVSDFIDSYFEATPIV